MSSSILRRAAAALALAALAGTAGIAPAFAGGKRGEDDQGQVKKVTVTVVDDDNAVPAISPKDFAVYRGKTRQEVLEVKGPAEAPVNVAVLIQDGLDVGVGHELDTIKDFIQGLPEGSKVMVGYLRGTHLQVTQDFTTDRAEAAEAIRLPLSTPGSVSSAPFQNLVEALRRFDGLEGRNQVVMVSSGLELNRDLASAAPSRNIDLDRVIARAQRQGIPVYGIFANMAGPFGRRNVAITYGQGSLNRLAHETGGKAFFNGTSFVTFDHALATIKRDMQHQYLINYRADGDGELEVTVETPGVEVRHAN
jgi:VWFA-related protein